MGTASLRKARRIAVGVLSLALLLVLGCGAPENLNIFDTVSPPADSIRNLFYLLIGITGVIFVLVAGVLLYCIWHFREQPGTTGLPAQLYGSKPVEVAWTVAPLLIVFVLFMVVFRTILEVNKSEPPPGSVPVTVVGHQWWWEYRYQKSDDHPELGDGFITANELHVPHDVPVYFDLESADVIHSFWFPRLAGKTDVVPGRTNHTWFRVVRENGTYFGQCTEYCGTQHANMILRLESDPPAKFAEWATNERKLEVWAEAEAKWKKDNADKAVPWEQLIPNADVRQGRADFLVNACMNCHTIRGTTAKGTFGPDLTHLANRGTLASAMVPNDTEWLTKWIDDPQKVKPGCWMPAMKLDEKKRDQVVKYLQSLK